MKTLLVIYSATRGSVDGTNYSSTWCESEETLTAADTIGRPPMKINCKPELIDQLRGKLPCTASAEVKMISGGGAKGGMFISSIDDSTIKPVGQPVTSNMGALKS